MQAKVLESLPNARYRVALDDGNEVLAHISGDMRIQVIRILPGDRVDVEISPFDATKARIVRPAHPNHPTSKRPPPHSESRTPQ